MARNKKRKIVQQQIVVRRPPTILEYRVHRASLTARVLLTLIRSAAGVAIAYFTYRSIRVLSGQETMADIAIRFLGNLKVSQWAAWLLAGGGIVYGWRQQSLRRKVNETLGVRNSELEQVIDPRRTSSRLTRSGETDPKDSL